MAIRCAYCGGEHAAPGEVRACWQRTQTALEPEPHTASSVAVSGPDQLARGLVIPAGAPIPSGWEAASRIVIDRSVVASPDSAIAALLSAAAERQRVVIELDVPFAHPPRSTTPTAPYEVGPRFQFGADLLHHLVWSNSIDATGAQPSWPLLAGAVALGATPVDDGRGDVQLPDGTRAWLDGGPARRLAPIAGIGVLHAVAIEHGSLALPLDRDDSILSLADDQRLAVQHDGAAARIIAPAGSGKTRVLTERARHLLRTWRVPPSALSLVAFNKRAQEEMRSRTTDLPSLNVRTLNSIALAIVNGTPPFRPQPASSRTIDEGEQRRIIGELVQFPRRRNIDPVATWIEALGATRLGLQSPTDVEAMYDGDVDGLAEMFPRYRAALQRGRLLDFDEQIYRAIELLLADADVREAAQRACRLLLVDEFQDLTPAHVLLIRLVSAPGLGVFGVGDDDQTIYGYNGADPSWLIEFSSLFPNAGAHPLETNYRCPADVVAAADRLVRHNLRRVPKTIRSSRPGTSGLRIVTNGDTLSATLEAVRERIAGGRAPSQIAVLTRVNALLAPVHVGLVGDGIPIDGGIGSEFLERVAIRSSLAWLRLATSGDGSLASTDLAEALRRPSRTIHPNVATWVCEQRSVEGLRRLAGRITNDRDAARVAAFADDIARLRSLGASATTHRLFRSLAEDVGLGAAVATLDDTRRGMNRGAQNDDLIALSQLAQLQPDPARFGPWLRQQLVAKRSNDGVTLATIHRVKGQEWPVVVLHHTEADQFPHRLADDVEEERRVFHVGITRGSTEVIVIAGNEPSPFIEQMQREPQAVPVSPKVPTTPQSAVRSVRSVRSKSPASTSRFEKGSVLAAEGLVLVDGGHEWVIEAIEEGSVVARLGASTRLFKAGATVATVGRQRGTLRIPESGSPSAASVRAYDRLRQLREQLRNGKPAYVVFHDATLERIALELPTSLAALRRIDGVGPAKLEQYGDAVLLAIEDALNPPP